MIKTNTNPWHSKMLSSSPDAQVKMCLEQYGVRSISAWYDEQIAGDNNNQTIVLISLNELQKRMDQGLLVDARHTLNRIKWVVVYTMPDC